MAKHTPGPWELFQDEPAADVDFEVYAEENVESPVHICRLIDDGLGRETCRANARLIAASPKLLAELQSLRDDYIAARDIIYVSAANAAGDFDDAEDEAFVQFMDAVIDRAQAVIAEALGE